MGSNKRQYSAYQRKYFRQKFKDFAWVEVPTDADADTEKAILEKLEHLTQSERAVYEEELKSEENIRYVSSQNDPYNLL